MKYVEKNLLPDEHIMQSVKIHWAIFLRPLIFFIIGVMLMFTSYDAFGIFFLFVSSPFLIKAYIVKISTEFAITNKRIISKQGLVSRKTTELNLSKVESLNVDQDIDGRLLNYGTLTFNGTGGVKTFFKFIAKPLEARRAVNTQIESL